MRAWLGRAYGKERGVGGQVSGLLVILTVSAKLALVQRVRLVALRTRPHLSLRPEHSLEGEQTLRQDGCTGRDTGTATYRNVFARKTVREERRPEVHRENIPLQVSMTSFYKKKKHFSTNLNMLQAVDYIEMGDVKITVTWQLHQQFGRSYPLRLVRLLGG